MGEIFGFFPKWLLDDDLTTYALFFLMFFVGVSIGSDRFAFSIFGGFLESPLLSIMVGRTPPGWFFQTLSH